MAAATAPALPRLGDRSNTLTPNDLTIATVLSLEPSEIDVDVGSRKQRRGGGEHIGNHRFLVVRRDQNRHVGEGKPMREQCPAAVPE